MAGRYDLTVEQGATFSKTFTLKDASGAVINLSTYTGRGQIRKYHRSDDPPEATFVVAFFTNGTDGKLVISLTAAVTAALTAGETVGDVRSKYVYDIELFVTATPTIVRRILEGDLYVSPEVTRA